MAEFKIQKFLVYPIVVIYNEKGRIVTEKRLNGFPMFVGSNVNLEDMAEKLEKEYNARISNQASEAGRLEQDKRDS